MNGAFLQWRQALVPMLATGVFALGMWLEADWALTVFILVFVAIGSAVIFSTRIRARFKELIGEGVTHRPVWWLIALTILPLVQVAQPYSIYVETRALVLATMLLAMAVSLGLLGMVDLGIGAYVGVGAYVAARLSLDIGCPVLLTPFASAFAGGFVAGALSRPLGKLRGHYFAIATLGIGMMAHQLFIQLAPLTGGVDGIRNIPSVEPHLSLGGLGELDKLISYYWALVSLMIALIFVWRLAGSQLGRCFMAVRDDEVAAASCGVAVGRHRGLGYTVAGAIAGFAGSLHCHTVNYIAPADFGIQTSIYCLTLAILAANAKPIFCLLVALGMAFVEEKLRVFGDLRLLLVAIATIAIVLARARTARGSSSAEATAS